jgi:hypothetical protein
MGSWKKMILGEKMPDKNDPQYKERYEKEVASGRKFARWTRIDKLAAKVQRFACSHPKWFLGIVFGIVISCFSLNIYRIVQVCNRPKTEQTTTAAQRQEQLLKEHRGSKTIKPINHDTDRTKEQN